jgi:hypothetical protein
MSMFRRSRNSSTSLPYCLDAETNQEDQYGFLDMEEEGEEGEGGGRRREGEDTVV